MIRKVLIGVLILGSVLVGLVSYDRYASSTSLNETALADHSGKACAQESDCPTIYCIRAPCPYNVCSDGVCKLVVPTESPGAGDESCKADSDCMLVASDCSSCRLYAVNVGYQQGDLGCSNYTGPVCRVAPMNVSCVEGSCTAVPYVRN